MEQDEELKSVREKKLRELMKKACETKEKKSAQNKPIGLTDAKFREIIQTIP